MPLRYSHHNGERMRILVVGSGGREHALAWKLSQEAEVVVSPGNALSRRVFASLGPFNEEVVVSGGFDLVVVGPEDPLIDGLADRLRAQGVAVFGPGAAGAQLEGSKAFSKEMMARSGVRTAAHRTFTEFEPALAYGLAQLEQGEGLAVKASGNALGKGVILCRTPDELQDALHGMMVERVLGTAADEVVIEQMLRGYELSLMTLVGDHNMVSLPIARDYKRALDGDRGPNTGGMGTFSTPDWPEAGVLGQVEADLVAPMIAQLQRDGIPFRGTLFTGVMMQDGVPYCLEYNVRFGDPETQSFVRRLGKGFAAALLAAAAGDPIPPIETLDHAVVSVVLASEGYPGAYSKGHPIQIGDLPEGVEVFGAGIGARDGGLVTNGGRVLAVSAVAPTLADARARAYAATESVDFEGKTLRTDIAAN